MIKDFWFPVHFQLWIQIAQQSAGSQHAIVIADELIIAFGWLAGAFNKKVSETQRNRSAHESSIHFSFRNERDVRSLRKASVPLSGFSM